MAVSTTTASATPNPTKGSMKFAKILPHPQPTAANAARRCTAKPAAASPDVTPEASVFFSLLASTLTDDMLASLDPAAATTQAPPQTVFDEWLANDLQMYDSPPLSTDNSLFNMPSLLSVMSMASSSDSVSTSPLMLAAPMTPTVSTADLFSLGDLAFDFGNTVTQFSPDLSVLSSPVVSSPQPVPADTYPGMAWDVKVHSPKEEMPLDSLLSPKPANQDEVRRKRQNEFLSSLPPEIALKRRRMAPSKKGKLTPTALAAQTKESTPEAQSDDQVDPVALKRQKNTDAARRSRMRKMLRIETLETRVVELETENTSLQTKVSYLEAEKESSRATEANLLEKIRALENQLLCAHQATMAISL
ncbi:hypothetical protein H4R34_005881 [Dimargaris verticillata]|uniref:BZIP domain-containing protein n=1 Tax=Dimargaris verticillata TaxID=2761393 RepID=A0A9W8AVR5_9FUNG|nr:hypothetical protein H4R34_005881 [Dimargaris verticillata]